MPDLPPHARQLDVPQAVAAAASLRRQGRLDDAEKLLRGVLQLDATHVDAHNNLGNVLAMSRNYAEAVSHYRKAKRLSFRHGALARRSPGRRHDRCAL